jgi:hypothetical protein
MFFRANADTYQTDIRVEMSLRVNSVLVFLATVDIHPTDNKVKVS